MMNCKTDGNLERSGKDIFDHSDHRVGPKGRAWEPSTKPIAMGPQYLCPVLTVINFVLSKF
jgi:hypothetical protein